MSDGSSERLPAGAGPNGWIAFAGVLLFLNGMFSAFWGLTAILDDKAITVGGNGNVTLWDFTTWGWVTLLLGALMVLTAIGLFVGSGISRALAIIFVVVNSLAQFGVLAAFPLWSIFVITLNVVILYQLIARWQLEE